MTVQELIDELMKVKDKGKYYVDTVKIEWEE